MSEIKEDLLMKYVYKIKTLESIIISFNKKNSKHTGYIINLNDYNHLKNKIQYEKNKNKLGKHIFDIKDDEKIMTIKDIEFKTTQYLTNMLLNENKYIIIDKAFWKVICQKGKENSPCINYEIAKNISLLKVKFRDNEELTFDNRKNNILEESNLKNKLKNNFDLIKRACQNIKSYYEFEKKIQNGGKISGKGYLVEKDWIDKWKEQIHYEAIKYYYLRPNESDKEIRDKLINIFEINKYKYTELKGIKNQELSNKQKIEECLKNNSLVLVNSDFIESFERIHSLSEINYNLYENNIEIYFGSGNSLKFQTKDNIIPQFGEIGIENENVDNNQNPFEAKDNSVNSKRYKYKFAKDIFSILFNFNLGQKIFFDKVENSKNNIDNYINDYYLVNSDTFYQFLQFFSYLKVDDVIKYYNLKSILDINDEFLDKIIKENSVDTEKIAYLKDDFFKKFKLKNFFDIKLNKYSNTNEYKFYTYPSEFQIVSKIIKEKICEIYGDESYNNIEEISLGFITGNIIFKLNKGKIYDSLSIFSLSKETNGIIKFTPEVLISFNTLNEVRNFSKLIKDETLIDTCIKKISDVNTKYECRAILINKQNHKLFT